MTRFVWTALSILCLGGRVQAQEYLGPVPDYAGPASVGSSEPLFLYDDLDRWKHGWVRAVPYYGGYHSFRPYNYHHVFSQSQTAAGWGTSPVMPYSQQFWHRYEDRASLSGRAYSSTAPAVAAPYAPQQMAPVLVPTPLSSRSAPAASLVAPVQFDASRQQFRADALLLPARPAEYNGSLQEYIPNGPALP